MIMSANLRTAAKTLFVGFGLLGLFACGPVGDTADAAVADAGTADVLPSGFPAPRDDLTTRIGRNSSLEVATWNIENFPANSATAEIVADIITSLDLDFIALQEIADELAFFELVERLPEHDGVLSTHEYSDGSFQKVAFLYRTPLISVRDVQLLFQGSGYEFPRPPLKGFFTATREGVTVDFTAITLHLKAGRDEEDRERRAIAMVSLESYARSLIDGISDDDVILLGDFNERLTLPEGRAVFAPFLNDTARYRVSSADINENDASFLPGGITLDHIVTSASLQDEIDGRVPVIPRLNADISGFQNRVSDHLPVVLTLPVFQN